MLIIVLDASCLFKNEVLKEAKLVKVEITATSKSHYLASHLSLALCPFLLPSIIFISLKTFCLSVWELAKLN